MLKLLNGKVRYKGQAQTSIQFPDVSLSAGMCLGLYGPSGLGKSTLAKVLAGMQSLSAGELKKPEIKQGQANPVQWVSQQPEFAFNPRLTLRTSLHESWRNTDYLPLLPHYGIEHQWLDRRPSQVSGGQLQRLNLVRALLPSTRYLICDEITAHLDMLTQQQIWQALMADAHQRKLGLLVISHDEDLLAQVCDNTIYWNADKTA